MSIPSKTSNREVEMHFCVFVDLGVKKHVRAIGGMKCPMVIRDDYSRYTQMYFISHKYDAADTFAKFLTRSDNGDESSEGKLDKPVRRDGH